METLQTETTPEEHTLIISDVRFRPNSTQLATSSFDSTIRLWDAAQVRLFCLIFQFYNMYFFLQLFGLIYHPVPLPCS